MRFNSYGWLILSMFSWGLANPLSDIALETLPVGQMFLFEIGAGFLALSIFQLLRNKKSVSHENGKLPWKWIALLGLFEPGMTYLFGNLGYASGTVATGLIIMASETLVLAVLGIWVLKEKIEPKTAFAIFLGFTGVVISGWSANSSGVGDLFSNLSFLLAAIAAASYAIAIRKIMSDSSFDATYIAWGQSLVSFGFAAVCFPMLGAETIAVSSATLTATLAAIGAGVFGVAIPFVLFAKAAPVVPARHSAIALNIIPIVGIGIGALLGRGFPTNWQYIGGALVLLSLFAISSKTD